MGTKLVLPNGPARAPLREEVVPRYTKAEWGEYCAALMSRAKEELRIAALPKGPPLSFADHLYNDEEPKT
jgi:hypothetical protein